jgi:hypothetical protein
MSAYTEDQSYGHAADWLIGTAKRNPEALLVLAAGCALLMRSGGLSVPRPSREYGGGGYENPGAASGPKRLRENLSQAADGAAEYAADVQGRISRAASAAAETAGEYTDSVTDYAADLGRNVSEQASQFADRAQSTVRAGVGRVLREQPLAVVVLGVAAGAALAALFPSTEVEDGALGPAREAIADATAKVGKNLAEAAGEAGQRLKQAATERGLDADGLKSLAHEVADKFTAKVSGDAAPGGGSAPSQHAKDRGAQ